MDYRMPVEAACRITEEDYKYVDVRSIPEFVSGHPVPAVNIPLLHMDEGSGQMVPNTDFMSVVQANYSHDDKLVLGCRTGHRSAQAGMMLEQVGFTTVCNMDCGFAGEMNQFGQVTNPGWQEQGLPSGTDNGEGVSYESISRG